METEFRKRTHCNFSSIETSADIKEEPNFKRRKTSEEAKENEKDKVPKNAGKGRKKLAC